MVLGEASPLNSVSPQSVFSGRHIFLNPTPLRSRLGTATRWEERMPWRLDLPKPTPPCTLLPSPSLYWTLLYHRRLNQSSIMDLEDVPLNTSHGNVLPPPYATINSQSLGYHLQAVPGTPYFMIMSPQPTTSYQGDHSDSVPMRPASPPPSVSPFDKTSKDFDPLHTQEVLLKMQPLTVTFSVLLLLACLVAFILGIVFVLVHGSYGLFVANSNLFVPPLLLIFNILQLIYAIHGSKCLRRIVPYGAFVFLFLSVIGFIVSAILSAEDFITLWVSLLTMGLVAAIQLAYSVCATRQAKLLFRAEINESYYMPQNPSIKA